MIGPKACPTSFMLSSIPIAAPLYKLSSAAKGLVEAVVRDMPAANSPTEERTTDSDDPERTIASDAADRASPAIMGLALPILSLM